jgi:hypothetical protein
MAAGSSTTTEPNLPFWLIVGLLYKKTSGKFTRCIWVSLQLPKKPIIHAEVGNPLLNQGNKTPLHLKKAFFYQYDYSQPVYSSGFIPM